MSRFLGGTVFRCSYAGFDTVEVRSIKCSGLHQGQKCAFSIARKHGERKRNFVGQYLWARRYFVSSVGRDEAMIRDYIRHQEKEDERVDQLNIWG